MRTQYEKNKEILMDEIEEYCEQPMTIAVAERLSICHGAIKAMCMLENGGAEIVVMSHEKPMSDEKPAYTPELDGDTEFEKVVMAIPTDSDHMKKMFDVFSDHMEQLSIVNRRAYDNILMRLREVAKK